MPDKRKRPKRAASPALRPSAVQLVAALAVAAIASALAIHMASAQAPRVESFTIEGMCSPMKGCHTIRVFMIRDFFPTRRASAWRDAMRDAWDSDAGWLYTTNNNGSANPREWNAKVRSLDRVSLRRSIAQRMRALGHFAYSKWELGPEHKVVQSLEAFFEEASTAERVASAVNASELVPGLSDLFVTHYASGDFLSAHNDGLSGTWAMVVSLAAGPEWHEGFGGELCFPCAGTSAQELQHDQAKWCTCLPPIFNSAIIFRTRNPPGPLHKVMPVREAAAAAGWRRFGITGWYNEAADVWSKEEKLQNAKMRARRE